MPENDCMWIFCMRLPMDFTVHEPEEEEGGINIWTFALRCQYPLLIRLYYLVSFEYFCQNHPQHQPCNPLYSIGRNVYGRRSEAVEKSLK